MSRKIVFNCDRCKLESEEHYFTITLPPNHLVDLCMPCRDLLFVFLKWDIKNE
jgi:hypothetical protein